jgi:D-glycero-alpha-D-manno-heptose 1-phosphate guanylyltransferase
MATARSEGVRMPRAFVLAGGFGLRLRSVVADLPKVLAPVDGRPFLDVILRQLARDKVRHVTLCTGYGDAAVRSFCGDGSEWGLEIRYSHETAPLGTAGAVRAAWDGGYEEDGLVLNGDSFFDVPLADLVARHRASGAGATIAVHEAPDAGRYGALRLGDRSEIVDFVEKGVPGPALVNGGIYALRRDVVQGIEPGASGSFEREVFPAMAAAAGTGAPLLGAIYSGFFIDIGVPDDYAQANDEPGPIRRALEG